MPSRHRAPARSRLPVKKNHARPKRAPSRVPAHRTYSPELLANVRRRYEETPEPVVTLAADLGIHPPSFYRLAIGKGWVRRNELPQRDLSPALRILEEARALEEKVLGSDVAQGGAAPPTPDSSPPFAALMGGGEQPVAPPRTTTASEIAAEPRLSAIERLERAAMAELAVIEAMRAKLGKVPARSNDAARTVRSLSLLTQTMQHLQRLRAAEGRAPQALDSSHDDDVPADLDEFRRRLARRIDAFVASRTEPGGGDGAEAAAPVDGAR